MSIVNIALVVTRITIVVNCIVLHYNLLCASAGYRRSDGAATPVGRRWRHHGWMTSSKLKILVPESLARVACSGRKVTRSSVRLALLLLHKVAVTAELGQDMIELRLAVWKATIQGPKTVPHVTVGHAHTVHECEARLAGRQCNTVNGRGTVVDY